MTPKQKELLIRAQTSNYVHLDGSGEHAAVRAMCRKGWVKSEWSIDRDSITHEGWDALKHYSRPVEFFSLYGWTYLLRHSRPIATITNVPEMEKLLANSDL